MTSKTCRKGYNDKTKTKLSEHTLNNILHTILHSVWHKFYQYDNANKKNKLTNNTYINTCTYTKKQIKYFSLLLRI